MVLLLRVRTRDGTERLEVEDNCTLIGLRRTIEEKLGVPVADQTLSMQQGLLMTKNPDAFDDLKANVGNDDKFLRAIGLNHGAMVYLKYSVAREPTPTLAAAHRSDLQGRKMTVEGMIALQTRIERQETPHCASVSFDAHAANAFQAYVSGTLGFSQMRFGWMYGTVSEEGAVEVNLIYEPEQEGAEDTFKVMEDTLEDARADAIAGKLGYVKVGCVFNVTTTKERAYTLSAFEVRTMARYQAAHGDKFVTAVVMMLEDEDAGPQVSFEPFQVSDQCVKLWSDGWFHDVPGEDAGMTRLVKDVIVVDKVSKDVAEVDNDRWLVPVKILDHEGPLQAKFPVENRLHPVQTVEDLRDALRQSALPYAARLADFHLLLFLSLHLDLSDMALIVAAVKERGVIADGYRLIIDSIAGVE
uniref:MPN domain-containing protein n=1 Tax=Mantoniella antarctica TaxID=81844 RepID=A0A7S0T130_9CHLO|eukprot:CAMPEP_0181384348 /NCGR_PEP_ID=MMETSP1106-20121128/21904_1 /TAXON_ID=81844 /ORGANISM="Mantoniella antarctica, Strain SL-175" /LENGTH=413 /DNA_ID=CAMNT_0023504187 /DNA_START=6 /DNA_END=1247 /DNA_ORIENTATION=+